MICVDEFDRKFRLLVDTLHESLENLKSCRVVTVFQLIVETGFPLGELLDVRLTEVRLGRIQRFDVLVKCAFGYFVVDTSI